MFENQRSLLFSQTIVHHDIFEAREFEKNTILNT